MTTTEKNKLIAEFMGLEDGLIHYTEQGEDIYYSIQEVKYHTSWDWLMPVVEKINSDKNNCISIGVQTENAYKYGSEIYISPDFNTIDRKRVFASYSNTSILETCYNVVSQFIRWYNENKQP